MSNNDSQQIANMNLDDLPLPWSQPTLACLTEIVAFHAQYEFSNLVHLDLRLADGRIIRPFEYQDTMYVSCLSHAWTTPLLNYAAVYEVGQHTNLFLASRLTLQAPHSSGARSEVVAYQYREKSNRIGELWLLAGQTWHWVRQPVPDRLQMIMQSLNDIARNVITFVADPSGEAKDIHIEWINK
jgi:hypothetical protein